MEINLVNCFCTQDENSGNPAAIVFNFSLGSQEKQLLAKELGTPVTVFLSNSSTENRVEFFYPDTEMPLCLHGTIGAASILLMDKQLKTLVFRTKHDNKLFIRREKDIIQVLVSLQPAPEIFPQTTEILKMLNLNNIAHIEPNLPLAIASVGSPKLLVPLKSFESLANLNPNFDLIKKWSKECGVNGLYVYVKDSQHHCDFYARGFNPKTGHNEDAATGVAAAALAFVLKKNIIVGQGNFMKRPSEIAVSYDSPEKIWVGGRVIFISKLLNNRTTNYNKRP